MCSIQRTMNANIINVTGFFKVILILFVIFDLSVFGERLLWQNEAEINAEPVLRHYNHHKNKQRHSEDVTEGYSKISIGKTNLRHRSHHHRNNHHTTTTTTTTTTTSPPPPPPSPTTIITRAPEEHRLRHSNKFYQTFNLNHDYNREKSNVRRYINQSSYPTTTPNNPWKKLVSSSLFDNKPHHEKQSQSAKNFYNVSKLMQYRLFDRDGVFYSTRPPKMRHPYDVLKVPYRDRVRIKPVKKSFDHNGLWDDSRFMDDDNDDIDWRSNKRHLKLKSNNRNGNKHRDDYYEEDYYDDEEEHDNVDEKNWQRSLKTKLANDDDSIAIGIDLGTTFSCVAVFRNGKVEVIHNEQGHHITPSYVAFNDVQRLIGDTAKNQAAKNPTNTIFDMKRLIGRKFDDPVVQDDLNQWPFKVINVDSKPKIEIVYKNEIKQFAPEEVSAMVLEKMKKIAEDYLHKRVSNVVITVPAYFNDSQRQSTKDAARIAGLNVLKIINESTAAAIAYGLNKYANKTARNILIYDLGGGTLDVSVLTVAEQIFEVKAIAGDAHLGGEDFDKRLVEVVASEFERKNHVKIADNKRALHRLRTACEQAKRTLSSDIQASIEVDALFDGIDLSTNISRLKFEEINGELFRSTIESVRIALADANMSNKDIHDVVLVGGSTRIPQIQNLLKEFFERNELCKTINSDEAVVHGAAIQASILHGNATADISHFLLKDVTPLSLGIRLNTKDAEGNKLMSVIIKRNTKIPVSQTETYLPDNGCTDMRIVVLQGENIIASKNHILGKFHITGIPSAPNEHRKVNVTFCIDSDGILKVSAVSQSNELVAKSISITSSCSHLTNEAIAHMIDEAEIFRKQDEKSEECLSTRNKLEELCYRIKRDFESIKAARENEKLLKKCNETIDWLDSGVRSTTERYKELFAEIMSVAFDHKYSRYKTRRTSLSSFESK